MHPHRFPAFIMTLGTLLSAALPAAEPVRAVNPADVWDLTLLYKDDAAWHAAKDHVAAEIPKIKNYQGRLGESAATLRKSLDFIFGLRKEFVRLSVYDILGREVAVLVNEAKSPGSYTATWNAASVSSGVYFYRMQTENKIEKDGK